MSDYEMLDTFATAFSGLQFLFTSFVSILFAFLVASWLVAHKLNNILAIISIALLTLVTFYFMSLTYFITHDMLSLIQVIKIKVAAGESSLDWVGYVKTEKLPPLSPLLLSLEVLAYIGTLVFFFYQRKTGMPIRLDH